MKIQYITEGKFGSFKSLARDASGNINIAQHQVADRIMHEILFDSLPDIGAKLFEFFEDWFDNHRVFLHTDVKHELTEYYKLYADYHEDYEGFIDEDNLNIAISEISDYGLISFFPDGLDDTFYPNRSYSNQNREREIKVCTAICSMLCFNNHVLNTGEIIIPFGNKIIENLYYTQYKNIPRNLLEIIVDSFKKLLDANLANSLLKDLNLFINKEILTKVNMPKWVNYKINKVSFVYCGYWDLQLPLEWLADVLNNTSTVREYFYKPPLDILYMIFGKEYINCDIVVPNMRVCYSAKYNYYYTGRYKNMYELRYTPSLVKVYEKFIEVAKEFNANSQFINNIKMFDHFEIPTAWMITDNRRLTYISDDKEADNCLNNILSIIEKIISNNLVTSSYCKDYSEKMIMSPGATGLEFFHDTHFLFNFYSDTYRKIGERPSIDDASSYEELHGKLLKEWDMLFNNVFAEYTHDYIEKAFKAHPILAAHKRLIPKPLTGHI